MIQGKLRNYINGIGGNVCLRKRLPAAFGHRRLIVKPSSYLRYWTHSLGTVHSELLAGVLKHLSVGDSFWDIGANVGVATFAAARRVGTDGFVLSIEPDVDMCALLRRSAALATHGESAVDILPVAVSNQIGVARFVISTHGTTTNALDGFGRLGGVKSVRTVPTVTLDWLLKYFRKPDLIKIDVEGAEWLVLEGGDEVFTNHRPTVFCEVGSEVADQIRVFFERRNYALFDAGSTVNDRVEILSMPAELLAIPRELFGAR